MSGIGSVLRNLKARSHITGFLLLAGAMASALAIETLHDHACTGDGCMLCMVVGCAQVLLVLCLGIAFVHPALRVIAWMLSLHVDSSGKSESTVREHARSGGRCCC